MNKIVLVALLLLLSLTHCSPETTDQSLKKNINLDSSEISPRVIYGSDDRLDIYQVTDNNLLRLANSTVALIRNSRITDTQNGDSEILTFSYKNNYNLCPEEPFVEQNVAAFCSGFLVGENLVVTAGHCISTQSDCNTISLVFGFSVTQKGKLPKKIQNTEIYKCVELIKSEVQFNGADFAVIRLERNVVGHIPLKIRRQNEINSGENIVVIGHPAGLPTKVAAGSNVRKLESEYFVTNLDTYGGNSGSAVFNATTGIVEGILVRGETDYVAKKGGNCRISNYCPTDGCRGEDVTKITVATSWIPNINTEVP